MVEERNIRFGHVFVLHMLPDGRLQHYQSFINQYTLQTHLGRSKPLNEAESDLLVGSLAQLERHYSRGEPAGRWASEDAAAYHHAFSVHLYAHPAVKNNVTVYYSVPCVVPAWNGTATAAKDAARAEAVAAFVAPYLQLYSMVDLPARTLNVTAEESYHVADLMHAVLWRPSVALPDVGWD